MIPTNVLSIRYLASATPALAKALGAPKGYPCLAMLTADSDEYAMMRYYQGLIALRKHYDIFRSNGEDVTVTFEKLSGGGMVAKFVAADGREALVVINPTADADTYTLTGSWNLVADGTRAGASVLDTMSGEVSVAACSVLIFVK